MKKDKLDEVMRWQLQNEHATPTRAFNYMIWTVCNVSTFDDSDALHERATAIATEFRDFVEALRGNRPPETTIPTVRECRVMILRLLEVLEAELQIDE